LVGRKPIKYPDRPLPTEDYEEILVGRYKSLR